MKPPSRRARHAVDWLQAEPGFARLGEQAARLAAIEADLRECVPGLVLTAVAFERDVLVVGAAHAAVAAKIRQMGPTVVAALGRRGWKVASIRFKPSFRPVATPAPRLVKGTPTPDAAAGFAALSERVDDPRLKAALRRFAARHGAGGSR
jgi:hypothetical protein